MNGNWELDKGATYSMEGEGGAGVEVGPSPGVTW